MLDFFFNNDEIKPNDVHEKINQGNELFILDVREPDEYAQVRLNNAVLIPKGILESGNLGNYKKETRELEKAKSGEIIVVCRSGFRSLYATRYLKSKGFSNVKSMKYGIIGWVQNGYPVQGITG